MSAPPYMKLFWGDYHRKTRRLTKAAHHGAYLLLIGEAWQNGGSLPNDDAVLAGCASCTPDEWAAMKPLVMGFFNLRRGKWVHDRVREELASYETTSRKRKEAGRRGGKATNGKDGENTLAIALHLPAKPEPEPEPEPIEEEAIASLSASADRTPASEVKVAVAAWNDLATRLGLPLAKSLEPGRAKAIRARLKAHGLDGWTAALEGVALSRHCRGENDRNWRADIDFVAQPKTFARLIEGFYGRDATAPAAQPVLAAWRGPADLRAAVVELRGEPFAISWLDRCGWRDTPRAIIAPTERHARKLREELGDLLNTITIQTETQGAA